MASSSNTEEMADQKHLDWELLKELECPVCLEYMESPIKMCETGHNICVSCGSQVPKCPSCKGKFTEARNFTLERIAAAAIYPCKNQEAGCEQTFTVNHKTVTSSSVCFRAQNVLLQNFLMSNVLGLILFLTLRAMLEVNKAPSSVNIVGVLQ
jgi:hypothetical protein